MVCILVVEDEPGIRSVLVDLLSDAGFETVEAETADAAVPLLRDELINLLISDINLPGHLDGIALAKAAREMSPSIPVVFISGRPNNLDDARALGEPVAFIHKPFHVAHVPPVHQRASDKGRRNPNHYRKVVRKGAKASIRVSERSTLSCCI